MTTVKWTPGKDPIPIIQDASRRGVGIAAEHVLGEAKRLVPHKQGILERSGRASHEGSGSTARAAVSFNTPYAVVQHERTDYRHDKNRQAKYLETALNSNRAQVEQIIASALRGAL